MRTTPGAAARRATGPIGVRRTGAVAQRVLAQLRRDPRTLVMLVVLPCLILTLLWWVFRDRPGAAFDELAPALLALIPFIVMFLVTSVTTLRERTSGTLERLLAMPLGKGDFLLGYGLAFGVVAVIQSVLATLLCVGLLGLEIGGSLGLLVLVAVVDALLGTALGLLVSAFARTEFQAVQFMPAVVIPQILLCGLFVDRDAMPSVLHGISDVLPLSYAVDAMDHVASGQHTGDAWLALAVVIGFTVAGVALGAGTLQRRTE